MNQNISKVTISISLAELIKLVDTASIVFTLVQSILAVVTALALILFVHQSLLTSQGLAHTLPYRTLLFLLLSPPSLFIPTMSYRYVMWLVYLLFSPCFLHLSRPTVIIRWHTSSNIACMRDIRRLLCLWMTSTTLAPCNYEVTTRLHSIRLHCMHGLLALLLIPSPTACSPFRPFVLSFIVA